MSSLRSWRATRTLQWALPLRWLPLRCFSSFQDVQHIQVPCASAGDITVSLYNLSAHSPTSPLVLWIPPFSYCDGYDPANFNPPRWLERYPTATLNYRWPGLFLHPDEPATGKPSRNWRWPTPLHDILFGYQWVVQHLAPADLARRDIFVYGSYLGASLAASLALTESHPHEPMAVRGLIAYNGIYNWTTFLPDHPLNKPQNSLDHIDDPPRDLGTPFHLLRQQSPLLFHNPSNFFDHFASPALFFHTSGLLVPPDFHTSSSSSPTSAFTAAVDALSTNSPLPHPKLRLTSTEAEAALEKATRKAYLTFPPRKSSLQIPQTLLLYDHPPEPSTPSVKGKRTRMGKTSRKRRSAKMERNSFYSQATHLADVMMRSVEMFELRDRMKWDGLFEDPEVRREEVERRVKVVRTGEDKEGREEEGLGVLDLNGDGEGVVGNWLGEVMEGRYQ